MRITRHILAGLLACLPVLFVQAQEKSAAPARETVKETPAKEVKPGEAAPKDAAPATPPKAEDAAKTEPPAPPRHPRADLHDKIADESLKSMLESGDPRAVVIAAKYARLRARPGKLYTEDEQNDAQEATMARALELAAKAGDAGAETFVRYAMSAYCGLQVERAFCKDKDRIAEFANGSMGNTMAWLMMSSRAFFSGTNAEAHLWLERAAKAGTPTWFYREALATGLKYARQHKEAKVEHADAEVAAFTIAGEWTLPDFRRFSMLCNPDPEGKLPKGRYEICRAVAERLIAEGETNLEVIVGHRAMERMALGEKKEAEAKRHNGDLGAFQADIRDLWTKHMKFPPQSADEAKAVVDFVETAAKLGERKATDEARARYIKPAAK